MRPGGKGFFLGAGAGMALALALVAAGSFLPQMGQPAQATSSPSLNLWSAATSNTTVSSAASSSAPAQGAEGLSVANETSVPPSAQSTTTVTSTMVATSESSITVTITSAPGQSSPAPAAQRPDSSLAAFPGESPGTILSMLSPLLAGLLVAALVYGAYSRRQDSS